MGTALPWQSFSADYHPSRPLILPQSKSNIRRKQPPLEDERKILSSSPLDQHLCQPRQTDNDQCELRIATDQKQSESRRLCNGDPFRSYRYLRYIGVNKYLPGVEEERGDAGFEAIVQSRTQR